MNDKHLLKYAKLIVRTGVNIQKGQKLIISSPIECVDFTRMITEIAYKEGASDVIIDWKDDILSKIKYLNAPESSLDEFPKWKKAFYDSIIDEKSAFLSISASDPEIMNGVDQDRIAKAKKARIKGIKKFMENYMANRISWCVVSIPTKAWAKKVFPKISEDEAIEKLWDAIFKTVRGDREDPVAAWDEHKNELKKKIDFLAENNFKYLYYKNSKGTDLKIELPENHVWFGGSEYTPEGLEFIANMPTEEVFTMPKKTGANGTVVSSKPLNYNGNLIEEFTITFKEGKVIDYNAKKGFETLKSLLELDEGSKYLGEVALVPFDSPISNSGIMFYNTLFDENASCHLAFGKAYPTCIKNGENMSKEELEKAGVNNSINHVDFMIGTEDLSIIGVTQEGKEIPVFVDGNFAN